jgi:hypothetical protein
MRDDFNLEKSNFFLDNPNGFEYIDVSNFRGVKGSQYPTNEPLNLEDEWVVPEQ